MKFVPKTTPKATRDAASRMSVHNSDREMNANSEVAVGGLAQKGESNRALQGHAIAVRS